MIRTFAAAACGLFFVTSVAAAVTQPPALPNRKPEAGTPPEVTKAMQDFVHLTQSEADIVVADKDDCAHMAAALRVLDADNNAMVTADIALMDRYPPAMRSVFVQPYKPQFMQNARTIVNNIQACASDRDVEAALRSLGRASQ